MNITVNDTINDDHQWGRVLLEGTDLAGLQPAQATAEEGHARWESRTPAKGTGVLRPHANLLTDELMRLEPSKEHRLACGHHRCQRFHDLVRSALNWATTTPGHEIHTLDNTCASLDERLLLLPSGCDVETENDVLTVEFTATVQWSLTMAGLDQGDVDVIITDYDGTQRESFSERWVLEREMTIDVERLMDEGACSAKHRDGRRCHGRRRPEPHRTVITTVQVKHRTRVTSGFDGTDSCRANPGVEARPFPSLTVRFEAGIPTPTRPVSFKT